MPTLQVVRGRNVDLRRYTNVHLYYGRRPFGPTDRYELWIKPPDGVERKFTINTSALLAADASVHRPYWPGIDTRCIICTFPTRRIQAPCSRPHLRQVHFRHAGVRMRCPIYSRPSLPA